MIETRIEPGSFRDRNSRVVYAEGRIRRVLNERALANWRRLAASRFFQRRMQNGEIVRTEYLGEPRELVTGDSEPWAALLEHERVAFLSYPYEWPYHMLKDAALLHLDLLREAIESNLILKDSTPFNVQWRGSRPVFIDIPSFEELRAGETWVGYRQFCNMFLYPLMLQAYKNIHYHPWLRGSLEGISATAMRYHMSLRDLFRKGVFAHVFLQSSLELRYGGSNADLRTAVREAGDGNADIYRAMILSNVRRLRTLIEGLEWEEGRSTWSDYAQLTSYDDEETSRKKDFVRAAIGSRSGWQLAWDLGSNTGAYSRIAAEKAPFVVAMDADHLSVDRLYLQLKDEGGPVAGRILPLVMNLADPSPALGWRGEERKSLPDRGRPDLILALALIHHVVIAANIPLHEFVRWLHDIAAPEAGLVIEFVTRADEMVQTLLRNKEDQYSDYTTEYFERCLNRYFRVERRSELKGGRRIIYFATRNPG